MLVLASRLQVGDLADLLSKPVLVGYLNGSALILIGTQVGKLLGLPLVNDQFFPRIAEALSPSALDAPADAGAGSGADRPAATC